MRFHIGFSKRISWKWLLLIGGVLLAFFGVGNHVALAATSGSVSMVPTSAGVYNGDSGAFHSLTLQHRTGSASILGDNYYINFSSASCSGGVACSPVYEGEVRWSYPAKNLCSAGQKLNYHFVYFVRPDNNHGQLFDSNSLSLGGVSSYNIISRTLDTGINAYVVDLQVPNNTSFTLQFGFDNDYNNFAYFASSSVSEKWTYSCDYTLADSTTDIINNNNSNTQEIIDSNQANTQEIIDSITIPQPFTSEDLPTFAIDNMLITSQTQKLFMLPIQLLNYVIQGMDSPNVCQPLTINLSSLNGLLHSEVGSISIPCMGTRVKNYIGENWYNTFDYLMGAIVFYYIASNIVLRIQQIFSGVDTLPSYYTSHGKTKTLIVNNDTGEVIG